MSEPPKISLSPPVTPRRLGLIIGNTRLHWGLFEHGQLQTVWHTPHLTAAQAEQLIGRRFALDAWRSLGIDLALTVNPLECVDGATVYCASVVPAQAAHWQNYDSVYHVSLQDISLANLYPTLGIDRALNLLGAGDRYGWPCLIIDAGTALTFTAGHSNQFIGGAILLGLGAQFAALGQQAAALPVAAADGELPTRWADNTPTAIRSGVIRGAIATIRDFLNDWQQEYPHGYAVFTGGDGKQLYQWLEPILADAHAGVDEHLAFHGLGCLLKAPASR
ncbi:MAG: pantothenate kinase [Leptolyngbyaceae cyanobacterium]